MTELIRCACGKVGQRAGSHGDEELDTDMFALNAEETIFVCLGCINKAVDEAFEASDWALTAPQEG